MSDGAVRPHLHQVDVIRSVTFLAVVSVHAILATVPLTKGTQHGEVAGAVLMLAHVNREAFFVLSTFLLFYTGWAKPLSPRKFWRKRLGLILLPYLAWTAIYLTVDAYLKPLPLGEELRYIAQTVAVGHYQMYFLVVMMQVYVVLPALMWLVRRTQGHHLALLAVSAVVQVAILTVVHELAISPATWFFGSYWFYLVLGALAAVHLEAVHAWLTTHTRAVLLTTLGAAVLVEAVYAGAQVTGASVGQASDPFQPVTIIWNVAAVCSLYLLGAAWARRRRAGSPLASMVRHASEDSFGVYLVHALFLWPVIPALPLLGTVSLPMPFQTIYLTVLTLALSVAFTELAFRTPLSRALVGRVRPRRAPAADRLPAPAGPPLLSAGATPLSQQTGEPR